MSTSDENIYLSFQEAQGGNVDTYVRTSTDGGKTLGPLIKVNGTGTLLQKSEVRPPDLDPLEDSQENTRISTSGDNVYGASWYKKDRQLGDVFVYQS